MIEAAPGRFPSAFARAPDGVRLAVESTGDGDAILFLHEFAGDGRSWAGQVAAFGDRYRCIVANARGYPPSDVPEDPASYSQDAAVLDALAVLDWAGVAAAHLVGLSMGAFAALHLAMRHPERCRSITVAGAGYGAPPAERARFSREADAAAEAFESDIESAAARYAAGPSRVQYRAKDPDGWAAFAAALAGHDPAGAARTLRGVQARRPSLFDLGPELEAVTLPTLILVGDEDDGCLETALMLKRRIATSALAVFPRSGHTLNLEEPARFNAQLDEFLGLVERGEWRPRALSAGTGLVGMEDDPNSGI